VKGIQLAEILLRSIGVVRNAIINPGQHDCDDMISELVIDTALAEALDGLEQFSHIIVIYWMHRNADMTNTPLKVHPRKRQDIPLMGLFATRAPYRPNPIGLSIVKLLERGSTNLKVIGLDAIDGTPIIDIKPYLSGDTVPDIKTPEWITKE